MVPFCFMLRCQPFVTGVGFLDSATRGEEGLLPGDVIELTGASGEEFFRINGRQHVTRDLKSFLTLWMWDY